MRLISPRGFQKLAHSARVGAGVPNAKRWSAESPQAGTAPISDVVLRKDFFGPAVVAEDDTILFTLSTPTVDRDQDTVSLSGWDLEAFKRNPVVLWAHDQRSPPIGRCTEISVTATALVGRVKFVPEDMPVVGPLAEMARRMVLEGFLSAVSVGFRPVEFAFTDDPARDGDGWFPGIDFQRQELLEFSIVPVPANAEALVDPTVREEPSAPAPETPNPALAEAAAESVRRKAERRRALFTAL